MIFSLASAPRLAASLLAITLSLLLNARHADAQDAPAVLTERATLDAPTEETTKLVLTAGGVLQSGNTEALQVNSGALFQLVRGQHAFVANATWVLGLANEYNDTVAHNVNAKARHDMFFTENDAMFEAFVVRWDRFAGLDPRLQGQIGYLRNLLLQHDDAGSVSQQFWLEAGYDLTGDFFNYDRIGKAPGDLRSQAIHSARLFFGYTQVVNENLSVRGSIEGLLNLEKPDDSRINGEVAATVAVASNLQAELLFRLQADTSPPGTGDTQAKPVDTTTQLNLVYTMQ